MKRLIVLAIIMLFAGCANIDIGGAILLVGIPLFLLIAVGAIITERNHPKDKGEK